MSTAAPMEAPITKRAKKPIDWGREVRQTALLILMVLGIHSFIAKPFYIPSGSMLPGLLIGDRLVVSKFPYGYSYLSPSLPILPQISGRLFERLPERGDTVVVKSPADDNDWIKRVIGLPGDTVEMREGRLILNGQAVPKVRIAPADIAVTPNTDCADAPQHQRTAADGRQVCAYPRYRETLPGGVAYDVLDLSYSAADNMAPVTVPADHVFLMGDNRDNSADSRVAPENGGLGILPIERVVGRAEFLTFSLNGSMTLNPLTWIGAFREGRAGDSLRGRVAD